MSLTAAVGSLSPPSAALRAAGQCPAFPFTNQEFERFEAADALYPAKTFPLNEMQSLDGSGCTPVTRDGTARNAKGECIDLGVSTGPQLDPLTSKGVAHNFPVEFLPRDPGPNGYQHLPTGASWSKLAASLQQRLDQQQFRSGEISCGLAGAPSWRSMYYVHLVPQLGFGSVIEYGMMFLVRSAHLGSQLVFGRRSSPVWTSAWACGQERSLGCYFNVSSCCGLLTIGRRRPLELPRRRNPLNLGLAGYNAFGAAWLNGQLAHFFFRHLTTATRREVERRRASILPEISRRSPSSLAPAAPRCIGMHIRGGDACHAHRYCPGNLTTTFFATAARMREQYGGVNLIVLATDSEKAASLCLSRPLGFDCRTMKMGRAKFESPTFIEKRVAAHADGQLSGSTVALDALADIDLLADCHYHVLMLRSAISRLAYALSLARKGYATPLVSMHMPYSPTALKIFKLGKMSDAKRGRGRRFRGRGVRVRRR